MCGPSSPPVLPAQQDHLETVLSSPTRPHEAAGVHAATPWTYLRSLRHDALPGEARVPNRTAASAASAPAALRLRRQRLHEFLSDGVIRPREPSVDEDDRGWHTRWMPPPHWGTERPVPRLRAQADSARMALAPKLSDAVDTFDRLHRHLSSGAVQIAELLQTDMTSRTKQHAYERQLQEVRAQRLVVRESLAGGPITYEKLL